MRKACAIRDLEILKQEVSQAPGGSEGVSRVQTLIQNLREDCIGATAALRAGLEIRREFCGSY